MTVRQQEPGAVLSEREKFNAELEVVRAQREVVGDRSAEESQLRAVGTRGTLPALAISVVVFLIAWALAHDAGLTGGDVTEERWLMVVSSITAVASLAWRFVGPWRLRRTLAELPFPIVGLLELLSEPDFDAKPTIELVFTDTPARLDDVIELVRAKMPAMPEVGTPQVELRKRRIAITLKGGESARFAFRIWVQLLGRNLLRDLHRAWPLARVEVFAGSRRGDAD